ncbi:MAG TPA: hypothetical protein VJO13_04875 [Ktedonobacterales bacterium]|nr:hypothetical protein [Ktedonobacterales bacterium]
MQSVLGAADMWDLTVANARTFAVGSGSYVVHNKGCDVFERYGSEDEAKAAAHSGQLEMKKTPDGRYHKGEKWIADEGAVNPRTLGKQANYRYRMEIETDSGTRDWLKDQGFDYKPNEPGRYGIPWDCLDEFNQRIRNIRISQW